MKQFVVDAFTDHVFAGNQAAVCLVGAWPNDSLMTSIAAENNFSETAFLLGGKGSYAIRWFTPAGEIDFCGHATLASSFVVLTQVDPGRSRVIFKAGIGDLAVEKKGDLFEMDFPAYALSRVEVTDAMEKALGARPLEAWKARDLVLVMDSAETVRSLNPHQEGLRGLDGLVINVTAAGQGRYDCVSRSFAPRCGIAEDPVCGSGHCHIFPFWAERLGKADLIGCQASKRGGTLFGHVEGDRCRISGKAALFSVAEILPAR